MNREDIDKKIMEFSKKQDGKIGLHNMYHIYSEDMDGNITGEAYAINSCTNLGLNWVYGEDSQKGYNSGSILSRYYSPYGGYLGGWLHLGTGWPEVTPENPNAGTPNDPNFNSMYNIVITIEEDHVNNSDGRYPELDVYFNNPFVVAIGRMLTLSTDYNYSNLATDVDIIEIGYTSRNEYNSRVNDFTLHARVTDANGNPSFIKKRLNEKLTITVYNAYLCPYTVMKNGYDKGWVNNNWDLFSASLVFLNPHALWRNRQNITCYYEKLLSKLNNTFNIGASTYSAWKHYLYGIDGRVIDEYNSHINTVSTNNQILHKSTSPSILLEGQHEFCDHVTGYMFNQAAVNVETHSSSQILVEQFIQQASEDYDILETNELTIDNYYQWEYNDNYNMNHMFGQEYNFEYHRGIYPSAIGELQELKMFNIKTHAFDIDVQYRQYSDFYFCTEWRRSGWAYMTCPDGIKRNVCVYINLNPQYAITNFDGSPGTIWATDAWWDVTTWSAIENVQNVEVANSKKRYYIKVQNDSEISLFPRYGTTETAVIPQSAYKHNITSVKHSSSALGHTMYHRFVISKEYDCLLSLDKLSYFDANMNLTNEYTLTGYNDVSMSTNSGVSASNTLRFCYGGKLAVGSGYYSNDTTPDGYAGIRIFDISDPTQAPTYVDIKVDNNPNITSQTSILRDFSPMNDKPYVVYFDNVLNGNGKYCSQLVDISTGTVTEIEDCYKPFLIRNSDYILYQDPTVMSTEMTFKIYDITTNQVVHSFTIPETYYGTYVGCCAYSTDGTLQHTYIYITSNKASDSTMSTLYYDYNSDEAVYVQDVANIGNTFDFSNYGEHPTQIFGCDDCAVSFYGYFDSYNRGTAQVYDPNNPTVTKPFVIEGCAGYLEYINDGKQLLFGTSGYGISQMCADIGHFMSTGYMTYVRNGGDRGYWCPYNSGNHSMSLPYKTGCLTLAYNNASGTSVGSQTLNYVPIEKFLPMYAKYKTRTIQSYNNPIRINGGAEITDVVTNIVSRTEPVE